MARLGNVHPPRTPPGRQRRIGKRLFAVVFAAFAIILLMAVGVGAGTIFVASQFFRGNQSTAPELNATSPVSSTTSTSTSSSTSTSTSSSTSLMVSTTTPPYQETTTTLPCGRDYLAPCTDKDNKQYCVEGYILDSAGTCSPVDCAPTAPSGKDGCGSWALSWCTPNQRNL